MNKITTSQQKNYQASFCFGPTGRGTIEFGLITDNKLSEIAKDFEDAESFTFSEEPEDSLQPRSETYEGYSKIIRMMKDEYGVSISVARND